MLLDPPKVRTLQDFTLIAETTSASALIQDPHRLVRDCPKLLPVVTGMLSKSCFFEVDGSVTKRYIYIYKGVTCPFGWFFVHDFTDLTWFNHKSYHHIPMAFQKLRVLQHMAGTAGGLCAARSGGRTDGAQRFGGGCWEMVIQLAIWESKKGEKRNHGLVFWNYWGAELTWDHLKTMSHTVWQKLIIGPLNGW